jgi:hypothetical protein
MGTRLSWRIVPGVSLPPQQAPIPGAVITVGPPFQHESMPDEVAILLPTNQGPARLIEQLVDAPAALDNAVLGLFLASPFLNVKVESRRLRRAGCGWITNLPSVVQHDEEFSQQLCDVELGFDHELERLARFRAEGFRTAAVVADATSAAAAAAVEPDAMFVLPRVADYAAGFPSLRQRSTAVFSAAEAARSTGWSGALFGLGEGRDADNEALWPGRLDGLVCRPERVTPRTSPSTP